MNKKTLTFGICIGAAVLFFAICIPFVINEVYKIDIGYVTLWNAADALSFYSTIVNGFFSVGILGITIYYNRKETERQIQAAFSQIKAPFFIIHSIRSESCSPSSRSENENSKEIKCTLKYHELAGLTMLLKNIGDGPAISFKFAAKPELQVSVRNSPSPDQFPIYIQRNGLLELDCDFTKLLSSDAILNDFEPIQTEIELTYNNTFGVSYSQKIILKCEKPPNNPRGVTLSVGAFSYQSILSDR